MIHEIRRLFALVVVVVAANEADVVDDKADVDADDVVVVAVFVVAVCST